jgi:hypothetical protein
MDLGFGNSNQRVGSTAASVLLKVAQVQESTVDDQLDQFDDLLNDEEALSKFRANRLQELQQKHSQEKQWRAAGHGSYEELAVSRQDSRDAAQEFFRVTKESDRVVVHFYRPSTALSDVFHKHLQQIAHNHLESRFVRINVEDCDKEDGKGASYLVEKLGIIVMPTLVLIHKRKAVHHVRGFDELGGTPDFPTSALVRLLVAHNVLHKEEEEYDNEDEHNESSYNSKRIGGVNSIRIQRG